ncbi:MAG TPA: hypothetical protein VD902_14760 [Symbiobacteriaceae bacterium]|nr:hypothetical protein [Symbiobacteriaceae bacterium]
MKRIPENQCRRCGRLHDETWQLADSEGRWAVSTAHCECGHSWTMLYTAPENLAQLRAWLSRGCEPAEGPLAAVKSTPWQQYRLEGVVPALVPAAS